MLIPLYEHWSNREWAKLTEANRLAGHTIVLNPNDGPTVPEKTDRQGWRALHSKLVVGGARVIVYIDLCKARHIKADQWHLEEKSAKQLVEEAKAAIALFPAAIGVFLDDFTVQSAQHREAIEKLLRELPPALKAVVVANPGAELRRRKEWRAQGVTHIVRWETNGFPPNRDTFDTHDSYIALGVAPASPAVLVIPAMSYAHQADDGKNPYRTLTQWPL